MTMTANNNIIAQNPHPFVGARIGVTSRPAEANRLSQETNPVAGSVGVSISAGLRAQLAEASQTVRSVEEASDSLRAAKGALGEASRILLQLRDVAGQASEEVPGDERQALSSQFDAGRKALEVIAETTTVNEKLTRGTTAEEEESAPGVVSSPMGLEEETTEGSNPFESIADNSGLQSASVDSRDSAGNAVIQIDAVIEETNREWRHIDALQRKLESTLSSPEEAFAALQSSGFTIRDADVARAVTEFSRARILLQTTSDMPVNAVDATRLGLKLL